MTRSQYNTCVDQYADGLFRFVLASLHNREEAEDVVQDSFAKVWERLDSVEFAKAKSYLFTTAYHAMVDRFRKQSTVAEMDERIQMADDNANMPYPDVTEVLDKALATLPEAQRTALTLRDYEGYSYQEIGHITGQSESQVKVNIFRARTALKNIIKNINNLIDLES